MIAFEAEVVEAVGDRLRVRLPNGHALAARGPDGRAAVGDLGLAMLAPSPSAGWRFVSFV